MIVTVGSRSRDDMTISSVAGNGPWTLTLIGAAPAPTVVGDILQDNRNPSGTYLITAISADRLTLTVKDINAANSLAPLADVAETLRAYSTIGTAEADIPDVAQSGYTYEIQVYNDARITESTVYINDTTLGSTGTFKITVPPGERHDGTAGTGAQWQCSQEGVGIKLKVPSADTPGTQIIEWLEIVGLEDTTQNTVAIRVEESGAKTTLRNLIIHDYSTDSASDKNSTGIRVSAANVDIVNCLFYDIDKGGPSSWARGIYISAEGTVCRILNCTFERCDTHAVREDQACMCGGSEVLPVARNFAAFNCSTVALKAGINGWHGDSGNNATDHLKAGAECLDNGADLSADFTDDLESQPRAAWDIGADEQGRVYYVDAATGDDTNDGLSTSRAWATATEVTDRKATFGPGDHVLFKRGQDYVGQIVAGASGSATHPIVFGAYGTRSAAGTKPEDWTSTNDWPRIGYDYRIDQGTTWTDQGAGVYGLTRYAVVLGSRGLHHLASGIPAGPRSADRRSSDRSAGNSIKRPNSSSRTGCGSHLIEDPGGHQDGDRSGPQPLGHRKPFLGSGNSDHLPSGK